MRLVYKLTIGFAILCLFVIISGLIGISFTNSINNKLQVVTEQTAPTAQLVDDMIIALVKSNNVVQQYVSETDVIRLDDLRNEFDKNIDDYEEFEDKLRNLITDQNLIANLDSAKKLKEDFVKLANELTISHRRYLENDEDKEEYQRKSFLLNKQIKEDIGKAVAILDEISARTNTFNDNAREESYKTLNKSKLILTLTTVISFGIAILIILYLSRSIIKPIKDLSNAASKLSGGNFDVELKGKKLDDELEGLKNTFNQMAKSLKNMIAESPKLIKHLDINPLPEENLATEETYKLNTGISYLIKEESSQKAFDIFLDKVRHNYQGLCISRINPNIIRNTYKLSKTPILWLSEVKEKNIMSTSDIHVIQNLVKNFIEKSSKGIVLLDRIDYLIAKHGFNNVLKFLVEINDDITLKNAILLVPVDPIVVNKNDIAILEKEIKELPKIKIEISEELIMILKFIENRKAMGKFVTFKDVGKEFNITAPTTQKKILELYGKGLIRIIKQGRNKLIELTKEGQIAII